MIIACTPTAAYIKETTTEEKAARVRGSYRVVKTVTSYSEIQEDFVKVTVYDPKLRCFDSVKQLSSLQQMPTSLLQKLRGSISLIKVSIKEQQ